MNKYKKIAMSAVAVVMAGAMMVPLAACRDNKKPNRPKPSNNNSFDYSRYDTEPTNLADNLKPKVDANGKLTYGDGVTIRMNVGNGSGNVEKTQSISYTTAEISGTVKMPDGKTYQQTGLKPAWASLSGKLGVNFTDAYTRKSSNEQITGNIDNLTDYDVITASLQAIVENSANFLNLDNYIYYMPNYKAFLKSNSVTQYSLTGIAEDNSKGMYAAPYFDGNDDIEKYDMVKREWVKAILDSEDYSAATTTFKGQATTTTKGRTGETYAEAYMGKTGKWTVDATDPSNVKKTVKVTVDYDAALNAAKNSGSELGKALAACSVDLASLTSGNIVDLQNAAIKAKAGEVKGSELIKILREYIKVAYKNGNNQMYTKLSDVFIGYNAAWDVDLLTGIMRCVVTSGALYNRSDDVYALTARESSTQRRVDLMALAGELYGVRGMESRYEYTYIDAKGDIQDSRLDADSYNLLSNMSNLAKEGLLYTGDTAYTGGVAVFMMHDYVQTQTNGVFKGTTPKDYDFAPVVTPVSKWDVDGDGNRTDIMRFTESWRSTKNTGFCIPVESVKGNADKLSAILTFIDYIFSADGQLLMTYGERSTSNTTPNGWWYCEEANVDINKIATQTVAATNYTQAQYQVNDDNKATYFIYEGKAYKGYPYSDRVVPQITKASEDLYVGKVVNGVQMDADGDLKVSAIGSYTDYARKIIGTTLPIGNKDQGFEYQCTAACGLDGANIVSAAIWDSGVIKHVETVLDEGQSSWYAIAPTALPLASSDQKTLKNSEQTLLSGTFFKNNTDKGVTNTYIDLLFYGLGANRNICNNTTCGKMKATGIEYVELLTEKGLDKRYNIIKDGWDTLKDYYKINY